MTTQALDKVYYNNIELYVGYEIFDSMFDPHEFGIEESGQSTGCYKGYVNEYIIKNDVLFLDTMRLVGDLKDIKLKSIINSKKIFPETEHVFDKISRMNTWNNLNYKIDFTGNFVGYNFNEKVEWPVSRSYYLYKYNQVFLFSFTNGKLLSVLDFTEDIQRLTKELNEPENIYSCLGKAKSVDGNTTTMIKKANQWFNHRSKVISELEKLHSDLVLLDSSFISQARMLTHRDKKIKLLESKPDACRNIF